MTSRSKIVGLTQLKNKVKRNAFDLSHRHLFTANVGDLLPIFTQWVNPNETIKLGYDGKTQLAPLQSNAFTRLRENVQFFFVPFSSLWRYFESSVQNMTKGQSGEDISKIAASSSESAILSTKMPYVNYKFFITWLSQIMDDAVRDYLNLYFVKGITDYQAMLDYYSDNFNSHVYDIVNGNLYVVNGTYRYVGVAKLLTSLGYGNFSDIVTYDLIANIIAYVNDGGGNDTKRFKHSKYGYVLDNKIATISNSPNLSIFPLLAYHKIVNEFYRYKQWQPYEAWTCNIDYLNPTANLDFQTHLVPVLADRQDTTLFDLEFSNLPLDYFLGVLPRAQYGDESAVSLPVSLNQDAATIGTTSFSDSASINLFAIPSVTNGDLQVAAKETPEAGHIGYMQNGSWQNVEIHQPHSHKVIGSGTGSMSISALRSSLALQKYKEIQNCNDAEFADQVLAHFGVKPKNCVHNKPYFITGGDSTIDFQQIVNTNLADTSSETNVHANGVGSLSCHGTFKSDTYGIIIGIYRCTPLLDYARQGIDRNLLKTDASDFPLPEFDSVGMQTQYRFELSAPMIGTKSSTISDFSDDRLWKNPLDMSLTYGYLPRYAELKTSYDRYEGGFYDALRSWVTGLDNKDLMYWRSNVAADGAADNPMQISRLLRAKSSLCKDLFAESTNACANSDKIWVGSVNTCVAVRPFSVYGLPWAN